jgi:hypothetical protein
MLFQLLHNTIQIRIPSPKTPRQPVSPSLRNLLPIRHHIKLTCLSRHKHHIHIQPILDEVHETRDLYLVVLSRRAMHDFNFHSVLRSALQILSDMEDNSCTVGQPILAVLLSFSRVTGHATRPSICGYPILANLFHASVGLSLHPIY